MTINKIINDTIITFVLDGRLDTTSAPQLESMIKEVMDKEMPMTELALDLEKVEYVSSAGLRIFVLAQKVMNTKGTFKLIHVNDFVKGILDDVGFSSFMNIE